MHAQLVRNHVTRALLCIVLAAPPAGCAPTPFIAGREVGTPAEPFRATEQGSRNG